MSSSNPQNERPKALSKQERLEALQPVAKQVAAWAGDDDLHGWAETVEEEADFVRDGYDLARRLEDHGVDSDMALAEILDVAARALNFALRAKQIAWAAESQIQPPYPVGTRLVVRDWRDGDLHGTIEEIYEHGPAQYCVKLDRDVNAKGNPRRIINFEDARPLALSAEGSQ